MGAYEYQPCMGDLDGNGLVNLNDLAILLQHYGDSGSAWIDGDLSQDGTVGLEDLNLLLAAYGTTCG